MNVPANSIVLLKQDGLALARRLPESMMMLAAFLCSWSAASGVPVTDGSKMINEAGKRSPAETVEVREPGAAAPVERPFFIREYRVQGVHQLAKIEVEEAVYPFLGPGRTSKDVEQARAGLEKAFRNKGYQTVQVECPPQEPRQGVVFLQVSESKVGRLRVRGSRFFSLEQIKKQAPSVAEGKVPNFNEITRDIIALNQLPDRRVTPTLKPGMEPGTVDIDLQVKDTLPLHGSIELNNRYSADTTELRINGSVSYNNLWQLGHSFGASFQVAPERPDDAKVFSGFYIARFAGLNGVSFMLNGTKQDSNVSTLGGSAVAGRGEIIGLRAMFTLPEAKNFFHTLSVGMDYKHFDENVLFGGGTTTTPITYWPFSAAYGASWTGKGWDTELDASVNLHFRGLGSSSAEFDSKRFRAEANYIYLRGDLAHRHELPAGMEVAAKVQGQVAGGPLPNGEQFSAGGIGTVRGYLESAALGDNALLGSLELRGPLLVGKRGEKGNEWLFYVFCEGGFLTVRDVLPEQTSRFELASIGAGTRIGFREHFHGSLDAGLPLIGQGRTGVHDLLVTFRLWADF